MKTLWRVENPNTMQGLWYTGDGMFSPLITQIPNAQSAGLPMGYDEAFKAQGRDWYSACDNIPDMMNWFSVNDLQVLSTLGYGLYEFTVPDYRVVNGHAAFLRETATSKLVPLSLLAPGKI